MTGRALRLDLTLPIPPGLNNAYCNVAGRGRVATRQLRAWRKIAYAEMGSQARGSKFTGAYTVSIRASDRALPARKDADGLPKAIIDALVQTGVTVDDSWRFMRSVEILWDNSLPAGTCRVTVIELPAPLPADITPRACKLRLLQQAGSHVSKVPGTPLPEKKNATPVACQKRQNAPVKAKPAAVPASVMRELKRRGINVSPERVRL